MLGWINEYESAEFTCMYHEFAAVTNKLLIYYSASLTFNVQYISVTLFTYLCNIITVLKR